MNYLSYESVTRQFVKSASIVLALIEQRQQVLEAQYEPAYGDEGLERDLLRFQNLSDLAVPSLKKSMTAAPGETPAQAQEPALKSQSIFPHLNLRQSRQFAQRSGGFSTTSLKKTLSSAPHVDKAHFDQSADDLLGLDQEFLVGNQTGAAATGTQASFFLLKSSPLLVSQA